MKKGDMSVFFSPETDYILKTLEESGFSAYAVGGCVRDILLGKNPHDFDITTSATPDETKRVFSDCKLVETGIKHGTVTVIYNSVPFEVTTFRTDGEYTDKRRPDSVVFGVSLSEDLSRRDFTVNALCMDRSGTVTDLFGGKEDLKNKVIRTVGNAQKRFSEDALRIMRAIRFSAVLGFSVESETDMALRSLKRNLHGVSSERIREELIKTLSAHSGESAMIRYIDVLSEIFPAVTEEKIHNAFSKKNDIIQRLSALLSDEEIKQLRLSREDRLKTEILKNEVPGSSDEKTAGRLYVLYGEFARTVWEYNGFSVNIFNKLSKEHRLVTEKTLPVRGEDIVSLGFSGKDVGEVLKNAAYAVADGKVPNDKECILGMIKNTEKFENRC